MKTKRIWLTGGVFAAVILVAAMIFFPVSGATNQQDGCVPSHVVQPDETLDSIAQLYNISPADLATANNLSDSAELEVGQELCIPTGESTSAPEVTATEAPTETLTLEATAAPTETLTAEALQPGPGIATRICVNGQVIDKTHNGLAGLKVIAQPKMGQSVVVKTDSKGNFSFQNLAAGPWTFRVEVPDSWKAVTPAELTVELAYGHNGCYVIRFKLEPLGCIIVRKIDSLNNPLANWSVKVSGPVDPEAKTSKNGEAVFTQLLPGTYVVSEDVPYPWKALTPTQVSVQVKPAWNDKDCGVVTFKNEQQPTSCVTGKKVDDNHKPLGGWKVYAEPASGGGPTFTTQTAPDGSFTFPNLTLGTWTIWEEVQQWWTPVTPDKFDVTLTDPSQPPECVPVRFKNRPPDVCAEGYKVNERGVGLEGWKVVAYSETDPAKQKTTMTDAHGYYRFNDLTLGNWVFEVQHEVGWKPISADRVKVPITGGKYCTQVPVFRNQSPRGCIEGRKLDNLRVGLPGWTVVLKPAEGKEQWKTTTDGTGYFRFDNLPVGKYQVLEQMQTGWMPLTPTIFDVEVTPTDDYTCSKVTFVNRQVARDICIDGYKLDQAGDVGLPGWLITAKNLETGDMQDTTTDGVGYFRFSQLTPGTYEISVQEQEGWLSSGPSRQKVAVSWPPKAECTTIKFYNHQEKVKPPDDAAPPDPPDHPAQNGGDCRVHHRVMSGDTMAKIANRYDASIREVAKVNNVRNIDRIYIGQDLCIP